MSRRDDVLFCKIAVTNGLLSEEQAKKAIGLCDRKEVENGRRPLVGALLSKSNVLAARDVQRVYQAVEKRLGTAVATESAGATRSRGRAKSGGGDARASRTAGRAGRRSESPPMDPQTLWMGIGGLVAFVVIIGVIAFLVFARGSKKEGEVKDPRLLRSGASGEAKADVSASSPAPSATSPAAVAQPAAPSSAAATPEPQPNAAASAAAAPPSGKRPMTKEALQQMELFLVEARRGDDPDQRAVLALEKLRKENDEKGVENPPQLVQFFTEHGAATPATPDAGGER